MATIVLVGINDVGGVIVGGCIGHFICTGGAGIIWKYGPTDKHTYIKTDRQKDKRKKDIQTYTNNTKTRKIDRQRDSYKYR